MDGPAHVLWVQPLTRQTGDRRALGFAEPPMSVPARSSPHTALRCSLLRHLPLDVVASVEPSRVMALRAQIDDTLEQAQVFLDFTREKSTHIAIAGLLEHRLEPDATLAVIVTGTARQPPSAQGAEDDIGAPVDARPPI